MAAKGSGIDIQEREALVVRGRKKGVAFQVTGCESLELAGDGLAGTAEPLGPVVAGLTGRDLILKYTRVPQVPDWQLAKLMDFEAHEIGSQAGGELSSDFNLLPVADEMTGEDTVLLALAKDDALESISRRVESARGSVEAYTPNAIALYNAFLMLGPVSENDTNLLAWIGERSLDIVLVRGASLLFARNVSGGLQVLDGAIAQAFNVREERARKIRRELLNLDPRARGQYGSSQEEKVAHSVQSVSGQLQAALRSTLAFCQSQTNIEDLQLKRAYLCGPGARVRGIAPFLAGGLGCGAGVWDPVPDLDLTQCPPEQQQVAADAGPGLVVALGLAMAPCFDELYSIEILPAAVKRRRRFVQRTAFNVAAAVLAVGFLGWHAVRAKASHEELQGDQRVARSTLRRVKDIDKRTQTLAEANADALERVIELEELSVPLHASLRVLREMRTALPSDLWLTKLQVERGSPAWLEKPVDPNAKPGGTVSKKPKKRMRTYLVVQGRGVPLTSNDLTSTFTRFKQELVRRNVPIMSDSISTTRGFQFEMKIDYLQEQGADGSQ